jgi:uncharacterized lipoprotein YajG
MNRIFRMLIAVSILTGCAMAPQPQLNADNPASPYAPEAIEPELRNSLAADDLTKRTHQLLAQANKQLEQPSPTPSPPQQMDQMPGMRMH